MTAKKYLTEDDRRLAKLARVAEYYAANRDVCLARSKRYREEHRAEIQIRARQYRERHPEYQKRHWAKRYGCPIELADRWDEVCRRGRCEICGRPAEQNSKGVLHKDHSHTIPPIPRGCLCSDCNLGLGRFQDSPDLLQAAIAYLRARDPRYRP